MATYIEAFEALDARNAFDLPVEDRIVLLRLLYPKSIESDSKAWLIDSRLRSIWWAYRTGGYPKPW